uniref:Glutaminase a n=1 Tax=Moniliophthora roreri TaxID=221103 RepID=A0A0W0F8G8_MONRR
MADCALVHILIFQLVFIVGAFAQSSLQPPAVPLAVRSPYFSSWLNTGQDDQIPNRWPTFWSMNTTLGMGGLARVDGEPYIWMGDVVSSIPELQPATSRSMQITPTRTIFVLEAGRVQLNVTFLSPIEPSDLVLQSLPFSYIYVDVHSLDGQSHSVQVYCDVSGEWLSSDNTKLIQWDTDQDNEVTFHTAIQQPGQTPHSNGFINVADDATLYWATSSGPGITWQSGNDTIVRNQFIVNGALSNTKDNNFRAIEDHWPVFGLSYDLGSVTSASSSVYWALGLVRDPSITWDTVSNSENYKPYFMSEYSSVKDALTAFVSDFSGAKQRSVDLDDKILTAARNVSNNYADLVSLAARQAFGGIETAYAGDSIGMFMKDIGNSQRIHPVEVIYASFPAFLYINATWGKYLLEPLLEYSKSTSNQFNYATSDLGNLYPNVEDVQINPLRQIEDSGSMLIMVWTHAKFTGDKSLLSDYYDILKAWCDNLIPKVLSPAGYSTADGQDTTNSTNLAVKGIIGIHAMADISNALGNGDDAQKYLDTATSYARQWKNLAWSSDHFSASYGVNSTWSLVYNLYADKLLGTGIVDKDMYDALSRYYTYANQSQARGKFGLPYDSNAFSIAMSHWTLLTAGALNDTPARDILVQMVHDKASDRATSAIFPSTYNINDGLVVSGGASPAQGAMFALLALSLESKLSGLTAGSVIPSSGGSKAGAIAGGVVGGAALIGILTVGWFLWRRKQRTPQHHLTPFTGLYTESNNLPHGPQSPTFLGTKSPDAPSSTAYPLVPNRHTSFYSRKASSIMPRHLDVSNVAALGGNPISPSYSWSSSSPLYSPASGVASRTNTNFASPNQPRRGVERSTEKHQLRAVVQNLRRELEDLRSREMVHEPPPAYN